MVENNMSDQQKIFIRGTTRNFQIDFDPISVLPHGVPRYALNLKRLSNEKL